jgi:hypothetical protein
MLFWKSVDLEKCMNMMERNLAFPIQLQSFFFHIMFSWWFSSLFERHRTFTINKCTMTHVFVFIRIAPKSAAKFVRLNVLRHNFIPFHVVTGSVKNISKVNRVYNWQVTTLCFLLSNQLLLSCFPLHWFKDYQQISTFVNIAMCIYAGHIDWWYVITWFTGWVLWRLYLCKKILWDHQTINEFPFCYVSNVYTNRIESYLMYLQTKKDYWNYLQSSNQHLVDLVRTIQRIFKLLIDKIRSIVPF